VKMVISLRVNKTRTIFLISSISSSREGLVIQLCMQVYKVNDKGDGSPLRPHNLDNELSYFSALNGFSITSMSYTVIPL
jgi:hypothetical protein